MSRNYPSPGIQRKFGTKESEDDTILADSITVAAGHFAILWKASLSLDVTSDGDLASLPARLRMTITIGSVSHTLDYHPFIAHATNQDYMDLGPWREDFGIDGLYSGVAGDNLIFAVGAGGSGIKTRVNYIYSD